MGWFGLGSKKDNVADSKILFVELPEPVFTNRFYLAAYEQNGQGKGFSGEGDPQAQRSRFRRARTRRTCDPYPGDSRRCIVGPQPPQVNRHRDTTTGRAGTR
jgi:hypothetical protein